jgi:hypothetical protein
MSTARAALAAEIRSTIIENARNVRRFWLGVGVALFGSVLLHEITHLILEAF